MRGAVSADVFNTRTFINHTEAAIWLYLERDGLNDGTSALARIRDFLIEHRGIIIRIATVYAILCVHYSGNTASIAYGIAFFQY